MTDYSPALIRTGSGDQFAVTGARVLWDAFAAIGNPLVTLPTGTTPLGIYRHLAAEYGGRKDVWEKLHYLSLDDYAGLPPDDDRLFASWLARELLDPLGVPAENRITFNSLAANPAQEATRIERWIAANGPLDIAVLGLGENGHIAFNEPGSAFDSVTRLVPLSPETRQANAQYWGGLDQVPENAYTLGLKTITAAKQVFLLVSGAHKAAMLDSVLNGPVTPDIPATILRTAPNVTVIADDGALKQ